MNTEELRLVASSLSALGVLVGVATYWRTMHVRRAEWLYTMYQKFYENEAFKTVRRELLYRPESFTFASNGALTEAEEQRIEALDDYLNFFELLASLWALRQIKTDELQMLFDYYLKNIAQNAAVRRYVQEEGFENLQQLIQKCEIRWQPKTQ
jgi:tRNA-dihydrouridine synthase